MANCRRLAEDHDPAASSSKVVPEAITSARYALAFLGIVLSLAWSRLRLLVGVFEAAVAVAPHDGIAPNNRIAPNHGVAPNHRIAPNDRVAPDHGIPPHDGVPPNHGVTPYR